MQGYDFTLFLRTKMPSFPIKEDREEISIRRWGWAWDRNCVPVASQPANQPRREGVTKDDSSGVEGEEETRERTSHESTSAD